MRKMRKWNLIVGARNGDYFGAGDEKSSLRGITVGFLFFSRYRSVFVRGALFRTVVSGRLSVDRFFWGGGAVGDPVYEDPHP